VVADKASAANAATKGIAVFLPKNSPTRLWSTRDTYGFSGTEGSMLCVAHGLADKLPDTPVFVVHSSWKDKVVDDGVAYVNLDDLPLVRIAIFANEWLYKIDDSNYSFTNIIKTKSVHRMIFWRQNLYPHYDRLAGGYKFNVPVGPQLVVNSWFEYYSVHAAEKWPDDSKAVVVIPNPIVVRPRNESAVIDQNKLVYLSAPRKGLKAAYAAFGAIHASFPSMRLKLFCPAYAKGSNVRDYEAFPLPESARANVDVVGAVGKTVLHNEVETALAVLYPTMYKETFGNSLAEANALGAPVIHIEIGALPETLHNTASQSVRSSHFVSDSVELVRRYRAGQRPRLHLHERFRPDVVVDQWVDFILNGPNW
jgi:hypothetical protein